MTARETAEVFAADESRDRGERAHVAALLAIATSIDGLRTGLLAAIERAEEFDREQAAAQPEQQCRSVGYANVPGAREVRTCSRALGHWGLHEDTAGNSWGDPVTDQTVQEVPCGHFGPVTDRGIHPRPQCKLSRGHTGRHNDGHGVWGVNR